MESPQNIKKQNNFAYIDGANLYKGVISSGWNIDFRKFRKWLFDKHQVSRAYYFIGMIPDQKLLYAALQKAGFTLIFKEVIYEANGKPKGNCDADLVLQSAIDAFENNCDKQILVSSDGDYASLVKFLILKGKIKIILAPRTSKECSILLKRTNAPITYLQDVKSKIEFIKEKAPNGDGTPPGSFS